MGMLEAARSARHTCPRCGYDLRGIIESWQHQCELAGTCAECGLAFDWAEVLCPWKFEPKWCVEFSPRSRLAAAGLQTLVRCFRPFHFWQRLSMPMDVRWGRLTAFVMLFVLPFVAGYTVLQTVAAVRQRRATGQWVQQQIDFIPKRTAYVSKLLQGGSWGVRQDGTEARLTPDDRATLQEELQRLTTAAGGSWGVRHSYFAAIAEALFLPFRSRSFGATSVPFYNRSNYPAPRSLRGSIGEKSRGVTVFVMGTSLVIWLVLPAGFVLLPISRRRARVRWGHVLRVALYSLVVLSLPGSASLLMLVIEPVAGSRWTSLLHVGHEAACVLMIPLLIGWWAAAVRRYLHISNGWAVALAFAAVGILLAALIGVTLNGV